MTKKMLCLLAKVLLKPLPRQDVNEDPNPKDTPSLSPEFAFFLPESSQEECEERMCS